MFQILSYLRPYRRMVALGLLALLVVDLIQLAVPLIVGSITDSIAGGGSDRAWTGAWQILAITVAVAGLRYVWRYFLFGAGRRVKRDIRVRLYRHLVTLPLDYFRRTPSGEIMAYASNDVDAVAAASGAGVMFVADATFMLLFATAGMLSISPGLTLSTLVPFLFLTIFVWYSGRVIHRRFHSVQAAFGELTERVREGLSGVRIIKAYARENELVRHFSGSSRAYPSTSVRLLRFSSFFEPGIAAFSFAAAITALYFGGLRVHAAELTIGDYVAFTSYLATLTWPAMAFGFVVNMMQRGSASARRIELVLKEQRERSTGVPFPEAPVIDVRDLSFAYAKNTPVLTNVSFRVEHGTVLGIAGLTGSGRSTLLRLLVHGITPPRGKIFYAGIDINDIELSSLRKHVSMAEQEAFVFAASIRENLMIAAPDAAEDAMWEAVRQSAFEEDIRAMPHGIDTEIGERGISLSGGQRQRLALARALLKQSRVLMLDDSLSAVDAEREAAIISRLSVRQARSVIITSNRVAALRHSDWILVLDSGRIVESGAHRDLLQANGLYASLARLQTMEQS